MKKNLNFGIFTVIQADFDRRILFLFLRENFKMFSRSVFKILRGQLKVSVRHFNTKLAAVKSSRNKPKTRVSTTKSKIPFFKPHPNIPIQVQEILSQISHLKSAELKIVITTIYVKIDNR